RRLHQVLAGHPLTHFDLRVPQAATADLTGEIVHEVTAVGKHILHRIGDLTLHTHLKMEGQWHVYAPRQKWRRPAFQARAILAVDGWQAVGFSLGIVELVRDERTVIGHLGPDPLGAWDAEEAVRRLTLDTRPAHVALLDQTSVAGFGNIYANELLFLRGMDPQKPLREIPEIVDLGARALRSNVDRPVRTFTGVRGQDTSVYGRAGLPCRRCGTIVRDTSLAAEPGRERRVFWCPKCQT